jgi:hypothetical protein
VSGLKSRRGHAVLSSILNPTGPQATYGNAEGRLKRFSSGGGPCRLSSPQQVRNRMARAHRVVWSEFTASAESPGGRQVRLAFDRASRLDAPGRPPGPLRDRPAPTVPLIYTVGSPALYVGLVAASTIIFHWRHWSSNDWPSLPRHQRDHRGDGRRRRHPYRPGRVPEATATPGNAPRPHATLIAGKGRTCSWSMVGGVGIRTVAFCHPSITSGGSRGMKEVQVGARMMGRRGASPGGHGPGIARLRDVACARRGALGCGVLEEPGSFARGDDGRCGG